MMNSRGGIFPLFEYIVWDCSYGRIACVRVGIIWIGRCGRTRCVPTGGRFLRRFCRYGDKLCIFAQKQNNALQPATTKIATRSLA